MEERRMNDTAAAQRTDQPMPRPREFSWIDSGSRSEFERRWHEAQADFIEDPRHAVGEASNVIADLMEHVGKNLRSRRGDLESKPGESDTEVMRLEMRRYKELMHRMLHGDTPPASQPARGEPVVQQPATRPQPRPQPKTSD